MTRSGIGAGTALGAVCLGTGLVRLEKSRGSASVCLKRVLRGLKLLRSSSLSLCTSSSLRKVARRLCQGAASGVRGRTPLDLGTSRAVLRLPTACSSASRRPSSVLCHVSIGTTFRFLSAVSSPASGQKGKEVLSGRRRRGEGAT